MASDTSNKNSGDKEFDSSLEPEIIERSLNSSSAPQRGRFAFMFDLPAWVKFTISALIVFTASILYLKSSMQHEPALPDESVKNQDLGAGGDRGLPIEINFSDETKRAISSKDYLGKVVLINFWASWCEPCVEEMPTFKTLEKKVNSKDLVILLINMDEEQEAVEIVNKIWGAQGFSFAKLFDFKKSSLEKLGIETLPSTYILDKQGRVAMTGTGANDWGHDNFVHSVQELLAEGH